MTTPIKDQNGKAAKGLTRRELIRLGLKGGSIVAVSLASPTVFACVRPSSFGSVSSHSGPNKPKDYTCGWGPKTWCRDESTYKEAWKLTNCIRDDYVDRYGNKCYATKHRERFTIGFEDKLLDAMKNRTEFAKYCSAAYLNARSGKCNVMTDVEVKDMWYSIKNKGWYEPTAGMKWYENDCVTYLKTTCNTA